MIDASPSFEAAKGISGKDLLAYLDADGWTIAPSKVDGIAILSKEMPDSDHRAEFIVPVKPGFSDEKRRIADALRTIAQIEGCSEAQIAERVQQTTSGGITPKDEQLNISRGGGGAKNGGASETEKIPTFFTSGKRLASITNREIEGAAQLVRKSLGLQDNKAFNIVELLENEMPKAFGHFRLEVLAGNHNQEVYSTTVPPRIFATEAIYRLARQGDARSRFLIAHEMGHLLLHSQSAHRERAVETPDGTRINKEIEAQASKFALFFLIPDSVARQFNSVESLSVHCQVRREVAQLRMDYLAVGKEEGRARVDREIHDIYLKTMRDFKQDQAKGLL